MSILDDLPGIVADALGPEVFYPATLTRDVVGPGPNAWTPGPATPTNYTCMALGTRWTAYQVSGGLVAAGDRKVLILSTTLSVEPEEGDRVTVRGETFTIVSDGGSQPAVSTDPARAVSVCRGRT